jgi:tRNA(Ile)-lysidine synthase
VPEARSGPQPPPRLTPAGFAASVAALAGEIAIREGRFALAVSGGGDSLALLRLGAGLFGPRATVLTFDHGLRSDSAAEAADVGVRAAGLGLPHAVLLPDAPLPAANLQAAARDARYRALARWCAANAVPFLLTGHQADDQAETMLLRLARGSGLAGLAGIRPAVAIAPGVTLIRPLLPWRRAALAAILADWSPVEDPANRDPRFDRTRARALLAKTPWLAAERVGAAARHLLEAEAALAWAAGHAYASRAVPEHEGVSLDPEALPADLRRRLLATALGELGAPAPDGPALARLQAALEAGRPATLGGILARPDAAGRWRLRRAPPRRH